MRKRFEQQLSLGVIPINEVRFNKRSRHELPEILNQFRQTSYRTSWNDLVGNLGFGQCSFGIECRL